MPFQIGYFNIACVNLSHWVLQKTAALFLQREGHDPIAFSQLQSPTEHFNFLNLH